MGVTFEFGALKLHELMWISDSQANEPGYIFIRGSGWACDVDVGYFLDCVAPGDRSFWHFVNLIHLD